MASSERLSGCTKTHIDLGTFDVELYVSHSSFLIITRDISFRCF